MKPLLITGGAGYIGSHTARVAAGAGYAPICLDNLDTGRADRVRWGRLLNANISNRQQVKAGLARAETVVHLAAHAKVGESMSNPGKYFRNNVSATIALLDELVDAGVKNLVFASSCSIYGVMRSEIAREEDVAIPLSPYGQSKLMCEQLIDGYAQARGLRWVALRYFNVAGVEPDSGLGEDTCNSTRVVPRAVHAALVEGSQFQVFGTDFDTADGTAIRDYVHVQDVAEANLLAIRYLERGGRSAVMNIGLGVGTSVRQIVDESAGVCGHAVDMVERAARPGDPACVIADISRAEELIGWKPRRTELRQIVETEVEWQRTRALVSLSGM